jgi:predicted DNA-binding transcriptional regulator YafY
MNRIDRVTAILIQLQSRKIVKAQDIADRFNISLRTVYRDIKTLEEAGIPILGEAGVGYSIMDGYRLPPVMFTKEEATAFLTAEKLIEQLTDGSTEESYKSAMYKIRAVLRSAEKDFLETLDGHIEVFKSRGQKNNIIATSPIQTILKSIAAKQVLTLTYFAQHNQQQTERNIEPVGIFFQEGYWHLIAYCRLRKDYRDFRIDRIKAVKVTTQLFYQAHPTLKNYLKQVSKELKLHTIIIQVDKAKAHYLDGQKYYSGFVSQKEVGDKTEMTFLTASIEGFVHWFLLFGRYADVISPAGLKQKIQAHLADVLTRLNTEQTGSKRVANV